MHRILEDILIYFLDIYQEKYIKFRELGKLITLGRKKQQQRMGGGLESEQMTFK